jgi:glycosyltransferase involved in cell wall biosynthesis
VRIALVSDAFTPQVSGVVTVLRRIVEMVGRAGHDAAVVAPEYPDSQPGHGVGELRVPSVAFPPYPAIRLSLPQLRRVAHHLDAFGPDLVHVVTEGPLGFVGRHYALRRGVPLVTSYHTHFPMYCRYYGVPALESVVWRFLAWFHGPARVIHTPGESARDALRSRGLTQAAVWGRGVDTAVFHPDRRSAAARRRLGVREDQVLILHVGRLASEKNLGVLAEAFALSAQALGPRAVFAVAGDGPSAHGLYRGLPETRKLGFIAVAELAEVYACADVCVFPSRTETCGLVALEAMASGVAVVAADAAGFPESVVHGRTGILVAPHDARGFAIEIVRLCLDAERRRLLGAAARRFAETRDSAAEDADLLSQYAAIARTGATGTVRRIASPARNWRGGAEGAAA